MPTGSRSLRSSEEESRGSGAQFSQSMDGGGAVAAGNGTHLGHDEPVAWEVGKKLEAGAT